METEQPHLQNDHISDYERAVCYYTLPRTTHPVTVALILVYAICLFEALGVLIYGLLSQDRTWTLAGTIAFGAIIVFGLIIFLWRALLNEIRRRQALVIARQAPDAAQAARELPDPFADHILLLRPLETNGNRFECTDDKGDLKYSVVVEANDTRRILDSEGNELWRVRVVNSTQSFTLQGMLPQRIEVYKGDQFVGRVGKRFTLGEPVLDVELRGPEPCRLAVREDSIYQGIRLVGRMYLLRDRLYLDIDKKAFCEPLLALFLTISFEQAKAPLF